MKKDIFSKGDILLPQSISLENWSVIACDQYSSEIEYWERVRKNVDDNPSTLNMIIPEAYLPDIELESEITKITAAMNRCITENIFQRIEDSFVYVERTLSDGSVRCGLVGTVDLESYSFTDDTAAILASEGTVLDRLPARIRVRSAANFETTHVIAFINDAKMTVIEPLAKKTENYPLLYDFELMEGGGHIKGVRISGDDADEIIAAMSALHETGKPLIVIGDGNHSLAAAKVYWDELKQSLTTAQRVNHPASRALLEINNVYDSAIRIEAIHRAVFNVDPAEFINSLAASVPAGNSYEIQWFSGGKSGIIGIEANCIGDMLASLQNFLDGYTQLTGCYIDYIHGEETVKRLSNEENCIGMILPAMVKAELFGTVAARGVFPKKSFSVGHAQDKRYYLECREIKQSC